MGSLDWSYLGDGLDTGVVDRGPTVGIAAPPGGESFVFGMNSLAAVQGAVALCINQAEFTPMERGCSIRGCLQRGPGAGPTGFSPFLFASAQGPSVNDTAYLLGLSDEDPHRIVLRKGSLALGAGTSASPGVLLASGESFAQATWLHLRLDVISNPNGDVILQVFRSDLERQPLDVAPGWQPVPGMVELVDDHLGINSGTQPLPSGRAGFGFFSAAVTRRGYFDHLEVQRQR